MSSKRRRTIFLVSITLTAGILLAGCGAGASSSDTSAHSAAGVADGKAAAPQEGAAQDNASQADPATAPDLAVDQRQIIYRGSLTVRVKDVNAAASQAQGIATTAGGFIGSDNRSTGTGTDDDTATVELRVPAGKFESVVGDLSRLGVEQGRQISTEDVTEQSIDLDARIGVQQARVDAANKLLSQAKTLSDLVMLEKEVATRESDLASLQAKKRNMADLVALSTITATLLAPKAVVAAPKPKDNSGFVGGLKAGWHGFLASLKVVLTVIGALLPFLLVIVPVVALVYLLRRRGVRLTRPNTPALATAGGPPPTTGPATAYGKSGATEPPEQKDE